ncbi:MAG: ABC transporter ATP-binding protein [Candidatus Sumerlaeia bacterium]|nr:ABC transporter ATP-binding protein [Candidatus Sumerlaeia bacterium]
MGDRSKRARRRERRVGIDYRLYLRLLSYLRFYKLRMAMIVLVLVGEALTTVLGLILLKPVLDLVFLGEIISLQPAEERMPLVIEDRGFPAEGVYVARLGGALDEATDVAHIERVQGWLGSADIRTAVVDLRPLTVLTDAGWSTLVTLAASTPALGDEVAILAPVMPPADLGTRLASLVASGERVATLAAFVDQVREPMLEVPAAEEAPAGWRSAVAGVAGWFRGIKEGAVEWARPHLERLQSYALRSNTNKYHLLTAMAGLLLLVTVVRCICGFFAGYLTNYVSDSVVRRIRDDLYSHILYLDEGFYSARNTGTLMNHIMQDVAVTKDSFETIFLGILKGPINLLAVLGAMLWISPGLTLSTLLMFPALLAPMVWVAGRVRRYSRRTQEKSSRLSVILHETFTGIRIVRAYSMERAEYGRFHGENWRMFKYRMRTEKASSFAAQLTIFLSTLAGCVVLLLNGYYILERQTLSGSDFIVFIGLMFTLYRPLKGMTKANNKIIAGLAGAERFFPILDRRSAIAEKPGAVDLPPFQESIRFENVSFAYGDEPVLREITLDVPAGKVIALVGASGSGKTTFVNLVPRFWDPVEGRILIDGHDLRDLTLRSLRRQIAIVTQESILFDDTVRANIAYGQDDIPLERVIEAAKAANAHQFIVEFPEGYDTVIGDRGQRISGGQRQRLAIARALVKGAPILILDEATSALDTESEREVQAAIDRLIRGRTAFVIAHRLSTIVNADEILVLKEGRIAERGSHGELLAQGREYAKLHHLQFRDGQSG